MKTNIFANIIEASKIANANNAYISEVPCAHADLKAFKIHSCCPSIGHIIFSDEYIHIVCSKINVDHIIFTQLIEYCNNNNIDYII